MSRAERDRHAGARAPRTETQRGRSMIEIDYWAEAAAIKRCEARPASRRSSDRGAQSRRREQMTYERPAVADDK